MRKTLFISHANPEENDFSKWLSLQLINHGYTVWCDVINLKGGEDFWDEIENEIRENSVKFLFVASENSNRKPNVRKELSVADKTKKKLSDDHFIIPLKYDNLNFDDLNIQVNPLNSIRFDESWAKGLKQLLDLLEEIPNIKEPNPDRDFIVQWWREQHSQENTVKEEPQNFHSNWFPISKLPVALNFHYFKSKYDYRKIDIPKLKYPAIEYKDYICTFAWAYDFMEELPKTETYNQSQTVSISLSDIVAEVNHDLISPREAKRLIIQLLNSAFVKTMQGKEFITYEMSKRHAFYLPDGKIEKNKINKIKLIGKAKDKHWHYAISAFAKGFPQWLLVVNSHIAFTNQEFTFIDSDRTQHTARRKKGKGWHNKEWYNRLSSMMKYLADENGNFNLILGSQEFAEVQTEPLVFTSTHSYQEPTKAIAEEESLEESSLLEYYEPQTEDEVL